MIGDFLSTHNLNILSWVLTIIGYLMPLFLAWVALELWRNYKKEEFIMGIDWVLLEIQIPRDVVKTPAAMELIFSNAFFHQSNKSFWDQYISGGTWLWFSLEIVSIDGKVHFFIRVPSRTRELVETQIYGQYPQAKVIEAEDYAFHIPQHKKGSDWSMWACEFKKAKEDFLPIKSYKDFGDEMRTGVKEEFKVDPITPIIEFMGSIPRGQQLWLQIIIRPNVKKYINKKTGKKMDFQTAALDYIDQLSKPYTSEKKDDKGNASKLVSLPKQFDSTIKLILDHMTQIHFDCGIRMVTLSDNRICSEDQFNNMRRAARLLFRQFSQPSINEIVRGNASGSSFDPTGLATNKVKKRMLNFYRTRTFFNPPIQYSIKYHKIPSMFFPSNNPQIFVLSSEELATIFHFPGMVSETPSFKRLDSKIAKPPSNLPI